MAYMTFPSIIMYSMPAMNDNNTSKEGRILNVMRTVLIGVIKDTTTDPRLKHPLSDKTIADIRDALELITIRQTELAEEAGQPMADRPYYVDEPPNKVAVQFDADKPDKKKD